ncbi:hypothetical protein BH10BDE1_BH10BDE1_12730 [soil metagenome]
MRFRSDTALYCALFCLVISAFVFLGWALDVRMLKSTLPDYITMKVNTALCFTVLSGSLLILRNNQDDFVSSHVRRYLVIVLSALPIVICIATLFQYLTAHNLHIDEFFITDPDGSGRFPAGRLAPVTAINFIALGFSFLLSDSVRRRSILCGQFLAVIVLFVSLQGLVGYFIGQTYLFGSTFYSQMALHTTIAFIVLAFGRLSIDGDRGLFRILTGKSPTVKPLRAILVTAIVVPPFFQWVSSGGAAMGLIDQDFVQLTQVVGIMSVMATMILISGWALFKSEEALTNQRVQARKDEEKFRALVDASAQIVWTCDPAGLNFEDTPTWSAYTGQTTDQLVAQGRRNAIHPHDQGRISELWRLAMQTKTKFELECRILHHSGEWRWVISRGTPVIQANGTLDGWIGMVTDINDRKQIEIDLQVAKYEAERASVLKSEFLANISHEIRTPLGAMTGYTDILRDPSLDFEQRSKYIETIARNGQRLLALIEDILDLSKIESGHITLQALPVRPASLVKECARALRPNAELKHVELIFEVDSSTPDLIITDVRRARQILINVIGNAIKFTNSGRVVVNVRSWSKTSEHRGVEFEIQDSGIGILDSQKEHIFEVFVLGDGSTTRRHGGTGLGLSLSRRLARELGGDVYLKSTRPGQGSVFVVQIEDRTTAAMTQPELSVDPKTVTSSIAPVSLRGINILVVDDANDNRDLIAHHLQNCGAKVEQAENGLEGYQMAIKANFDIVLMDLQMPVLDGYAATLRLRNEGFTKPIIALTAHAMTEVRQKCLDVGCTDHLAKPVDFGVLTRKIDRFVNLNREANLN